MTDHETAISLGPRAIEIIETDLAADSRSHGYDAFTGERGTMAQARPRQVEPRTRTLGKAEHLAVALPTTEFRVAFRLHWRTAQKAANAMVEAATTDDRMGLGVAADNLDQSLAELWNLRGGRDIDWQTILNHMQGMMRTFFGEKRAESLTVEQCNAIANLVKDYLGPALKTVDDLNEALRLIDDAGFDPYAAISADHAE